MRPFLKWVGGKYRLRHFIRQHLPEGRRLIEPFAGSAAIFLNTEFDRYLIADHNPDLINLYLYVQREGENFIAYCKSFFIPENNERARFFDWRNTFNTTNDTRLKSALFVYLNRHGFNGLCRYNSDGLFNVPFGRYERIFFPEKEMRFFHQKAQRAQFLCASFSETLKQARKHDVIYCDPPYVALSATANFTHYYQSNFCLLQQKQLLEQIQKLQRRNIPVLISNHDNPISRDLYQGAVIEKIQVRRSVNCKSNRRFLAKELLAVFKSQQEL